MIIYISFRKKTANWVSSLNTAGSRKTNIPQNIIIGPHPLLVRTKEVQGEDMFPSLGAQVVSLPAVFSERQAWAWPDIRQRSGDQLVSVTGRTLQRDREIWSRDAHYTWLGMTLIWKLVEARCDKDSKLGSHMLEISVYNKNSLTNVLNLKNKKKALKTRFDDSTMRNVYKPEL